MKITKSGKPHGMNGRVYSEEHKVLINAKRKAFYAAHPEVEQERIAKYCETVHSEREVKCQECGTEFKTTNFRAKFCKLTCRIMSELFMDPTTGCWLWKGCTSNHGHGQVRFNKQNYQPHRHLCAERFGPLGYQEKLVSLCGEDLCCNPHHFRRRKNRNV